MVADYHIHTEFSSDATGSMADCIEEAKKKRIREIGFSDHVLLRPLRGFRRPRFLVESMCRYVREFLALKEKSDYPIKLGVEVDFFPDKVQEIREFIRSFPFDYVVGSVHVIGDWIVDDPSEMSEYSRRDLRQVYGEYFGLVRSAVSTRLFDTLAHPDLIKVFGAKPKSSFSCMLEETAEAIAASNTCAEINTSGLRRPCHEIYPSQQFMKLLRKHDVPVTFGSDAHKPSDVGRDFEEAVRLAKKTGYTEACTFDNRKRTFCRF
jgi:histidinol-phosphatase (PHP family)